MEENIFPKIFISHASLDAPIHEMLHMLLGSLKFDP